MQAHTLQSRTKRIKHVQIGRGGKRGKTAGRGTKGQKARAGRKIRPEMRDIIKRLPKLRGRGKNSMLSIQDKPVVVNVGDLEIFATGATISVKTLGEQGLIRLTKAATPVVKILGNGELTKKLTVTGCDVSASARAKIEKVGGTISA